MRPPCLAHYLGPSLVIGLTTSLCCAAICCAAQENMLFVAVQQIVGRRSSITLARLVSMPLISETVTSTNVTVDDVTLPVARLAH